MSRRAVILAVSSIAAVALLFLLDRARSRMPPREPPRGEGVAPEIVDPGLVDGTKSPAGPDEALPTPDEVPSVAAGRPLPVELVLMDGSTGRTVHSEPIAFARRIHPASDHVPLPFVAGAPSLDFKGALSIFAERVRLTAVVWPELDLVVRVEEFDGSPAHQAELAFVRLNGRKCAFTASPIGASGEIRVRGVPWMRGEPVFVSAKTRALPVVEEVETIREEIGADLAASALTGLMPEDPVRVRVRLPEPVADPVILDAMVSDHNETDNDLPYEESLGLADAHDMSPGLRVLVLRADGSPAVGAEVEAYLRRPDESFDPYPWRDGRTGADGVVTLRFPTAGQVGVAVREAGYLFGDPVIATPALEPPEIVLREDPGADLDVFVVDGEGRPLPGAKISVDLPDWVWLENGVQRIGLFTGPAGRIRLPRLPSEEVTIRARYGTRRAKVVVRPPGTVEVRLVRKE